MKRMVLTIAVLLVCLGVATSAFAVPPGEMVRVETNQTFTGACCFSWNETITVTEPKVLVPVIVTWSTDYIATDIFHVGVAINDHPCMAAEDLTESVPKDGTADSRTFQFVLFPSDGLVKGNNIITLCGGGFAAGDSITLGFNTLAGRISK